MYCCARGTYHCQYTNEVQFEKLKRKYNVDEDIVVDYKLQDKVRTSTRDWIGIFPRGWTNLQQYLTFEYVVAAPKQLLSTNRSIMFLHTFHREASANIDYQFVYVSKEIKILGTSSYFRFVLSPSLRSPDGKPDMPEIVNDGHLSSIVSPRTIDIEKLLIKSKSIDSILETHRPTCGFLEQRRRTCRVCNTSKFDSSYTANKCRDLDIDHSVCAIKRASDFIENVISDKKWISMLYSVPERCGISRVAQFLSLLNEQLMARVGRLERDLGLAEAAVKTERMARAMVSKKLHTYETFVGEMFKCLNVMGIVKIRDTTKKEITIQKVKSKELSSIREQQGDKSVPIPEVSMLNRSMEYQTYNDEEITETNKTEQTLRQLNLSCDEFVKNEVKVIHKPEDDKNEVKIVDDPEVVNELFIKKEIATTVDNSEVDSLIEEQLNDLGRENCVTLSKIVEDSDNQRCCITKEAMSAINEQGDKKVDCKIEEGNRVQGKVNETEDNVDVDKKCCCCCHTNYRAINNNQIADENNLQEWLLEGECYLKMSNRMHRMIDNVERSLKNCLKAQGIDIETPDTSKNVENEANHETLESTTSSILIKCRNAKLSVIK